MRLDETTVAAGLGPEVALPDYDRGATTTGIVHVGVGGFHRAHQAMYVDALMRLDASAGAPWAICGVGLLPGDERMRDVLVAQDGLYTLTVRHPDGTEQTRVIGSIVEYLWAPDDREAVLEKLAAPSTRIVSLTVTEGGYGIDPSTGDFVADAPNVVADLANPAEPVTVFGFLVEALARRRDRGLAPFTVMSCDNIQGNGAVARRAVVGFARLRDERSGGTDLGDWIERHVTFPSSMVDRITPATSPQMVESVAQRTGVADGWPVVSEPFTQWVLEDSFVAGRPALERVGVQVVDDVEPYELMKLRLLNGSHQAIAYFGRLLGLEQVHDAAGDPDLRALVHAYMHDEARATLPEVPGVDLDEYEATLFERFTNSRVADTTARLAAESSDRIPTWVVPVVRQRLADGRRVDACAAVVASWTRYAEGVDERGGAIEVVDRLAAELVPLARRSRDEPLAFLGRRDLFGDLADDPRFTEPYLRVLDLLRREGARATLQQLSAERAAT